MYKESAASRQHRDHLIEHFIGYNATKLKRLAATIGIDL